MRTLLAIFIIPLFFTSSCSSTTSKDSLVHNQLNTIISNNESWLSKLEAFDVDQSDFSELRREYFSNHSTSSSIYSEVSLIVQYFNVKRSNLIKYREALDERDKNSSNFHSCQELTEEQIQELIKTEKKIIKSLKAIQHKLSGDMN